jgi:hypothetical protein
MAESLSGCENSIGREGDYVKNGILDLFILLERRWEWEKNDGLVWIYIYIYPQSIAYLLNFFV